MNKPLIEQTPSFWEAARRELEEYQFVAEPKLQPKWDIPEHIVIQTALSGRFTVGDSNPYPTSIDEYIETASQVVEAGATGLHIDFSFIEDHEGRRLDRDLPPVEAYRRVLDPLRQRFGKGFVSNLNVLNGRNFDECVSPARAGLAEVAPCAPGHPEAFMLPAIQALQEAGVKPELVIHSSGEIELAKRKLIDTGILKKPYNFLILYGLPFNSGRTLLSGTWVRNTQDMALHLFTMVNQIREIDPTSVITVCAAGRSTLYMTTLATMLGLHIRIGTEDTVWKYPNSDELLESNLQMFQMAKEIAVLHGRRVATADEYRQILHLP